MENNQVKLIPREIREAGYPTASFLSEEQQSQYKESIKKYSGKAFDSLNVPRNGSNLFKVILLNELGIKTASLSELEQAIDNGMNLRGTYEDVPSVVLRSNGDSYEPNDYLAKYLAKKIKKETLKHPLVLNGLKLKEDSNSAYGLILEPSENFDVFEASELDYKNNLKKFSKLDERGMPIFDDRGSRILYTKNDGLCRLFSNDVLGLDSNDEHLEYSIAHGRVVVVSPEWAEKNLGGYLQKLSEERNSQITEIERRFKQAENYLKTGKL